MKGPKPDVMDMVVASVQRAMDEAYARGLRDGLEVAEKAMDWLTRVPDTRRQREVREWLRIEIDRARAKL